MYRVLCTSPVFRHDHASMRRVLAEAGMELVFPSGQGSLFDPMALQRELKDVCAVLCSVEPYTREILKASQLRVVARLGVGYDAVDVAAATELGVAVTTTPGTNHHAVAETAIALITGVFRGLPWRYKEVLSGKWTKKALPRLSGKTIGLVGLGRIGRAMVPRCQGLELKVVAFDPLADAAFARESGVRLCSLDELLTEADIVSLHAPATPETTDLINERTLAKMKQGSVLINTSRGALVDEDALAAALRSGHLLAAGLDVFKIEPLPLDSPLLKLDNLLMLPHIAGLDEQSQEEMGILGARCVAELFQGKWPEGCVVNEELREGWKW